MIKTELTVQTLLQNLHQVSPFNQLVIAYSGGLDSHVLLDLAVKARELKLINNVSALHVDHQLQANSKQWAEHCQHICRIYDVKLTTQVVECENDGKGIEAAAREARYQAFSEIMQTDDVILTAHHQRDQVETLLLQLCRGSGLAGLAGMPAVKILAPGKLLRPFLNISYAELQAYAKTHNLQFLDDPSNADISFDRNFIRHEILPKLEQRWPKAEQAIAKASHYLSEHLAWEQSEVLTDMQSVSKGGLLDLQQLSSLPVVRQTACLRHWFKQHIGQFPSTKQLQEINKSVIAANIDRVPQLLINDYVITRHQQHLHCVPRDEALIIGDINWDGRSQLKLPNELGTLQIKLSTGSGIANHWLDSKKITIKFRQGGERCRLANRSAKPLKKLLQEANVPPWLRNRIPLLYLDGKLAAVIGYWICDGYQAGPNEAGSIISVQPLP